MKRKPLGRRTKPLPRLDVTPGARRDLASMPAVGVVLAHALAGAA